jgi:hypothetical protein
LPEDFCSKLLIRTCVTLYEEDCVDLEKDPLKRFTKQFPISLKKEMKKRREIDCPNLNDLINQLMESDALALSPFEVENPTLTPIFSENLNSDRYSFVCF